MRCSMPLNCRNGRWNAYSMPARVRPQPSNASAFGKFIPLRRYSENITPGFAGSLVGQAPSPAPDPLVRLFVLRRVRMPQINVVYPQQSQRAAQLAIRVAHVNQMSWAHVLDLPNQLPQQPLVGGHLVIGCRQHDNPEGELFESVLKLETPVDCQEDIITAFDFRDKNVVPLARPSQVSARVHGRLR